jgi:hypothetical protein
MGRRQRLLLDIRVTLDFTAAQIVRDNQHDVGPVRHDRWMTVPRDQRTPAEGQGRYRQSHDATSSRNRDFLFAMVLL